MAGELHHILPGKAGRGDGVRAIASSISPSASWTRPYRAVYPRHCSSVFPRADVKTRPAMARASGPEMRTMPIPPAACGVEMAAMVFGMGCSSFFDASAAFRKMAARPAIPIQPRGRGSRAGKERRPIPFPPLRGKGAARPGAQISPQGRMACQNRKGLPRVPVFPMRFLARGALPPSAPMA